jgi:hypothetical protein
MPRCRNCSRETMARHVTGGDPCWYCPQFMRSLVLSFAVGNADAVATIKANAAQHAADLRASWTTLGGRGSLRCAVSRRSCTTVAFGHLEGTRGIRQRSQGFSIDWATRHRRVE